MKNIFTFASIIFVIISTLSFIYINRQKTKEAGKSDTNSLLINVKFENTNTKFNLQVAQNETQRNRGLMFKEDLKEDEGMLFTFEDEQNRTFWMKNTYIPLDIIFLDSNKKINTIHANTKVNQTDQTYSSQLPSKYVIEIKGGVTEKLGIKIGDRVHFDLLD